VFREENTMRTMNISVNINLESQANLVADVIGYMQSRGLNVSIAYIEKPDAVSATPVANPVKAQPVKAVKGKGKDELADFTAEVYIPEESNGKTVDFPHTPYGVFGQWKKVYEGLGGKYSRKTKTIDFKTKKGATAFVKAVNGKVYDVASQQAMLDSLKK
jgi:hypothetical protein